MKLLNLGCTITAVTQSQIRFNSVVSNRINHGISHFIELTNIDENAHVCDAQSGEFIELLMI